MFTELMPLLRQRAVMITISDVGQGLLRVNIIPRKLVVDGSSDENTALTTPLSITGKAEELDRELPGQLATFTESIARTGSNLDELKTQHAAAVKALEAENKKKLDDKKKVNGSKTASTPPNPNPAAEFKDGKPVFGSKGTPPAGESRSLFDTATDQADDPSSNLLKTKRQRRHRNIRAHPQVLIPTERRFENHHDHRNHGSRIPLRRDPAAGS